MSTAKKAKDEKRSDSMINNDSGIHDELYLASAETHE